MEKKKLISACLVAWLGLADCPTSIAQQKQTKQKPTESARLENTVQRNGEQLRTQMMEACVTTLTKQMNQGGFMSTPSLYHTSFASPAPEGAPEQAKIPVYLDAQSAWGIDGAQRPLKDDKSAYLTHPGTLARRIATTYELNQAAYQQKVTGLKTEVHVLDEVISIKNPCATISLYGMGIADKARVAEEMIRTGSARTARKVMKYPTPEKKDQGYILQVDDLFIAVEDQPLE